MGRANERYETYWADPNLDDRNRRLGLGAIGALLSFVIPGEGPNVGEEVILAIRLRGGGQDVVRIPLTRDTAGLSRQDVDADLEDLTIEEFEEKWSIDAS